MSGSNDGSDVVMHFVTDNGSALLAECQTAINLNDELLQDDPADPRFKAFKQGHFFEVQDFSFGMNLEDKDPTQDTVGKSAQQPQKSMAKSEAKLRGKFADWKKATEVQKKNMKPYQLRMDEFSITKLYDRASPVLFAKCCDSDSFQSAALVKRRSVGEKKPMAYLRFDFGDVLITHIQWKNSDPMTEEIRFIYRMLKVRYYVTKVDLETKHVTMESRPPAEWHYEAELVKRKGR